MGVFGTSSNLLPRPWCHDFFFETTKNSFVHKNSTPERPLVLFKQLPMEPAIKGGLAISELVTPLLAPLADEYISFKHCLLVPPFIWLPIFLLSILLLLNPLLDPSCCPLSLSLSIREISTYQMWIKRRFDRAFRRFFFERHQAFLSINRELRSVRRSNGPFVRRKNGAS